MSNFEVCPPLLVLSPSADRIFYGLEAHPSMHTIRTLLNLILRTGHEKVRLQETDAAVANQRVFHHRLNTDRSSDDGILREIILCGNHQTNLIEGCLVGTTETSLITQFFSFTHFLQVSSHWPKLKAAVREYVAEVAEVTETLEPRDTSSHDDYVTELLDMQLEVKLALSHTHGKQSQAASSHQVELARYRKKLEKFKQMFNCDLTSKSIRHSCSRSGPKSSWCCKDDAESVAKLGDALIDLGVSSIPETPAPGKWTKLWNVLIFIVFGFLCHEWLPCVVPKWLAELKIQSKKTGSDETDLDPALTAVQEFAKITGKRATKTSEFTQSLDQGLGIKLLLLAIVDEPLRFLTFQFLSFNDSANVDPTLLQLANPMRSPLVAATQYLTSLLFSDRGRLILLERKDLANSWVRILRRLVMMTVAWVQRRHCGRLETFPFSLCLLADEKASEDSKRALCNQWDSTLPCCVRPGMARALKSRGVSGDDLMGTKPPVLDPNLFYFYIETY